MIKKYIPLDIQEFVVCLNELGYGVGMKDEFYKSLVGIIAVLAYKVDRLEKSIGSPK